MSENVSSKLSFLLFTFPLITVTLCVPFGLLLPPFFPWLTAANHLFLKSNITSSEKPFIFIYFIYTNIHLFLFIQIFMCLCVLFVYPSTYTNHKLSASLTNLTSVPLPFLSIILCHFLHCLSHYLNTWTCISLRVRPFPLCMSVPSGSEFW